MNYVVKCSDGVGEQGPFTCEEDAYRYAGVLDVDPACRDTRHEVEWTSTPREPLGHEELLRAVRKRLLKRAETWDCTNCGHEPLPLGRYSGVSGAEYCSETCAAFMGDMR